MKGKAAMARWESYRKRQQYKEKLMASQASKDDATNTDEDAIDVTVNHDDDNLVNDNDSLLNDDNLANAVFNNDNLADVLADDNLADVLADDDNLTDVLAYDDSSTDVLVDDGSLVLVDDNPDESADNGPGNAVTYCMVGTQTEITLKDINDMESDLQSRIDEIHLLKEEMQRSRGYPTMEQLQKSDKLLSFYTGFECFNVMLAIFQFIQKGIAMKTKHKLPDFESFLLTIMKLRLNLYQFDLAFRFGVSQSTVSRVFKRWIFLMHSRMGGTLIKWPNRVAIQRTMPYCFRVHYGLKVTAIIDCFELYIEKPSSLLARACTWSQYKHHNTAKYLIAITPQGVVSFISNAWGGRVSDQYITEHSGFLRNILHGDVVLADRGFLIEESLGARGASLFIPAFTRGRSQLSAVEIEKTRNIANVRIHVERVIGSVRQRFSILNSTVALPIEYTLQKQDGTLLLDAIVKVCCCLNNMCEGVVPFE